MDQTRAREIAKDAAEQAGNTATDAAKRVGEQVQPAFDQGKAVVQDLANQASEIGRQAVDRAGEFVEGVAPQARQAASNLYEQGARSGAYVREYAAQEPVVAMLIAGVIGLPTVAARRAAGVGLGRSLEGLDRRRRRCTPGATLQRSTSRMTLSGRGGASASVPLSGVRFATDSLLEARTAAVCDCLGRSNM